MDFKKINTETTCVTRQKDQFYVGTGNIYETVAIMAKRSDQIAAEMKSELNKKIEEYTTNNDSLEEVFFRRKFGNITINHLWLVCCIAECTFTNSLERILCSLGRTV